MGKIVEGEIFVKHFARLKILALVHDAFHAREEKKSFYAPPGS